MHVLSLLQNKFGLVYFRLFDGALETSNFRFEEAPSAITLLRCFLHENTQREKIARVKFAEELGTMSKNRLRWITLVRGPIWGIHSLTLMISCCKENLRVDTVYLNHAIILFTGGDIRSTLSCGQTKRKNSFCIIFCRLPQSTSFVSRTDSKTRVGTYCRF